MQSIIVNGENASGVLSTYHNMGIEIRGVSLDIPLDEVGTTDPSITLSGSVTGTTYTFHHSVEPTIRFARNEDVYLTTSNFSGEYSAVINYLVYGDGSMYYADLNKSQLPLPSRLKRNPRNGS